MNIMNIMKRSSLHAFIAALALSLSTGNAAAAIAQTPLFMATQPKPNVMLMLDNSGSMKIRLYPSGFNAGTTYTGIFDDRTPDDGLNNYEYDTTIPVNSAAYLSGYNVAVDTTATGAFKESTCTTFGAGSNCWSGNWLNWATSRRADASRVVLVGGKLESRTAFNYGTNLNYKIVANNEPGDDQFSSVFPSRSHGSSASYSPIANSTSFTVTSPAEDGATHTTYDPYAKLNANSTSYNLAVVVKDEPTGILHTIKDDVRLGISFYNYDPDSNNIYSGVTTDGGTMRFMIPKNPFVSKPSDAGGYRTTLEGYIGTTSITDIVDVIEHYPLIWGTTPLAENLWEVVQYFEQDNPHYDASNFTKSLGAANDPFYDADYNKNLSCFASKVLIITDGEPFEDATIPAALLDYDSDSDADDITTGNGADNLDDVAYWAFCDKSVASCYNSDTPKKATIIDPATDELRTSLRDLRTDTGMTGKQYLTVDTISFASGIRDVLQDTANNAGGTAYAATGGADLADSLVKSVQNTIGLASASGVAANSTRLDTNTLIYQASFDATDWSGQVQAFKLNQTTGAVISTPHWHTDTLNKIPNDHTARKIFTYKPPASATTAPSGTGIAFNTLADFSADQQTILGTQAHINYLRGDGTNEGTTYRERTVVTKDPITKATTSHRRLLGDVINSSPWYVGTDNFGYATLGTEGSSYPAFLTATASRNDTIYFGANDGMLHALDANTGVEKFAYVPATVIPDLPNLSNKDYGLNLAHQYVVDGSPRAGDVYIDTDNDGTADAWRTVLVGSTGAGGKGIFALDVTDPDNFDASKVLWEFSASSTTNTDIINKLGYTIPDPTIARMANGKWAAIIGNGYDSASQTATLFIIDIADGSIIETFDVGSATGNGLSTPVAVDVNGDKIVDSIYAGDLKGKMWKFDVSNTNSNSWGSAFSAMGNPAPIFTALDASSNPQPITAKPQVGRHPDGDVMIYFGTGKYFETGDNNVASPQLHTYYGLRDNGSVISGRSALQQQSILAEATALGFGVRVTTDNTVNYTDNTQPIKQGWYMNLQSPVNGVEGERVISPSLLRGDRIVFTTLIPESEPCNNGGTSWLMELDGITGARLPETPFDLTGDGLFTEADLVKILDTDNDGDIDADDDKLVVSGKKSTVGITKTPVVVSTGDKEYKYSSGTTGGLEVTTESGSTDAGRQSWRQLR